MRVDYLKGTTQNQKNLIKLTFRFSVTRVGLLDLSVQFLPFFIIVLSVIFVLLDSELFSLLVVQSQGFFKSEWVNFLENGLQSN